MRRNALNTMINEWARGASPSADSVIDLAPPPPRPPLLLSTLLRCEGRERSTRRNTAASDWCAS
eukprot:scaffold17869_cov29-Tisochrysis_lutea.AAC.2